MNIKGHAAIVTGGGSGLGEGTVRRLIELGAKVSIFDVNDRGAEVAAETGATFYKCDVSSDSDVEQALERSIAANGTPRALINCAGIAPGKRMVGRDGPMPLADFEKAIKVNLIGSFNVMRVVAAAMMQAEPVTDDGERGVIINTASVAAFEGQIGQTAYSASKGGIVGMTLPAARELAKFGVRVNTIAPGIMGTPMMAGMPDEVQQSLAEQIPFPSRLGKADEYAGLACHIIENSLINGETIRLDGAIRMQPK
jgi:NAD(P)-dependent dehydrogenase (short-subunit alcohol dehydrogenase family)